MAAVPSITRRVAGATAASHGQRLDPGRQQRVVHPHRRIAQVLGPDGEVDQLARIGPAPLGLADRQHHA